MKPPVVQATPTVVPFTPPPSTGKDPTQPAPKPGVVNLKLDGAWVEVPPGLNLIEAAKLHGTHIPYFCYHSRLSVAGQCRMCLVDAAGVGPPGKLSPGCQINAAEGLVVNTRTPAVEEARRATMEFHLVNHPVDCSICDQSGECKLQDYYMAYDWKPSRLRSYKVVKAKRMVLGPRVVLDQERCIMCTRCVRFMTEIPREPQLGVVQRGDHAMIDIFPGRPLDSNYSLNTVDICPVGALLSRDFRFTSRVWFLKQTNSICTGCSKGCNIRIEHKGETVYRYTPRENRAVNDVWMCDHGRLTYHAINEERVGGGEPAAAAAWSPALEVERFEGPTLEDRVLRDARAAAEKFKPLVGQPGVAVALSATASLEDLLAWSVFAREVLKLERVYATGRPPGEADHFLLTADRNPNTRGLRIAAEAANLELESFERLVKDVELGAVRALWMVGEATPAEAVFEKVELLVLQAQNATPLVARAHVVLPASSHAECDGTFVNGEGRLQRALRAFPPRGVSRPHWSWAVLVARALGLTWNWRSAADVFDELAERHPSLAGVKWAGIPDDGLPLGGGK